MQNYLKLYINHNALIDDDNKPAVFHCIDEVHLHYQYYYGSLADDPEEYDLNAGYYNN